MFSDITMRPLNEKAYSEQPFTFLDKEAQNDLAVINAINLIENGGRTAREYWQNRRLTFLLRHAQGRSAFWRKKLPARIISHEDMKYLPIQSRQDVGTQALEGSLIAADGKTPVASYASSGSTGTPVKVYASPQNSYYNSIRSLAQYFFNNLSLDENRFHIGSAGSLTKLEGKSRALEVADNWAGPLSAIFRNGHSRNFTDQFDMEPLLKELSKGQLGYLVCPGRYLEMMINHGGIEFIKQLGIKAWLHRSDYRDPEIVKALKGIGIPCFSNYSSAETGPIGFECSKHEGYFHVAHSNVVVERDDQQTVSVNGAPLGRLLVTHLHSYATPIVRYDIGDFGTLEQQCKCGHDGPTISNIFGRAKDFVRHPSGRLLPFRASTGALLDALSFTEFRVRQDSLDTITVELGGRETITAEEEMRLKSYLIQATDPAFKIAIKLTNAIDWSGNPKRLSFTRSVD